MKIFKSYSPLPASLWWLCREWDGGGKEETHWMRRGSQRGQKQSGSLKQTLSTAPPNWKNLFSSLSDEWVWEGKEIIAVSWGDEEEKSDPCRWFVSREWGKAQEEVTNFTKERCNQGWPPGLLLRGQQTFYSMIPSSCLQTTVSVSS